MEDGIEELSTRYIRIIDFPPQHLQATPPTLAFTQRIDGRYCYLCITMRPCQSSYASPSFLYAPVDGPASLLGGGGLGFGPGFFASGLRGVLGPLLRHQVAP